MVPGSRRRVAPGSLLGAGSLALMAIFAVLFHDYRTERLRFPGDRLPDRGPAPRDSGGAGRLAAPAPRLCGESRGRRTGCGHAGRSGRRDDAGASLPEFRGPARDALAHRGPAAERRGGSGAGADRGEPPRAFTGALRCGLSPAPDLPAGQSERRRGERCWRGPWRAAVRVYRRPEVRAFIAPDLPAGQSERRRGQRRWRGPWRAAARVYQRPEVRAFTAPPSDRPV